MADEADKEVYVRLNLPQATDKDLQQLQRDPVRLPVIPEPTTDIATLARSVGAIKTYIETREGQRSSWVEKNVTWRDLIGTQVVQITVDGDDYTGHPQPPSGPGAPANPPSGFPPWPTNPPVGPPVETPIYGAPPAPTNVQASGGISAVLVSWDAPSFSYFAHAEIWRATADVLASASLIGTSTGTLYSDSTVEPDTDYWYWVRFINKWDSTPGPYQSTAGIPTTTGADIPFILDQLTGQISQTHLDAALNAEIEQIDTLATEISALTAGVSGSFDPAETFYFDSGTEGWIADSAATVTQSNGHLLVDSTGSTPSIKHDVDFVVPGGKYPVVKVRLQRVAGSTWSGTLQWKTAGHGFGSGHQSVLADPALAIGDYATLEWDMSGDADYTANNILNLRLQFGAAADDDFDIDWLAVGRNAPGASVAMVDEEKNERTSADAAEASSRELLAALTTGIADPTGSENLGNLSSGLIYQSKVAAATATSAVASSVTTLQTTVNGHTATLSTQASSINGLQAQYTVKIDVAGHVSGYGLATETVNSVPLSTFGIKADSFYIAPPAISQPNPPTSFLYKGMVWVDSDAVPPTTYYYTGTDWSLTPQVLPFVVKTTPFVSGNKSNPPGVYMENAFIANGQITSAQIGEATIDNAHITATLDAAKITAGTIAADRLDSAVITAKVANLSVAQIGTGIVGGDFYSNTYSSSGGTAGWAITRTGTAVFNNCTVRGTVYATNGTFAGSLQAVAGTIGQLSIVDYGGTWGYVRTNSHWWTSADGGFVAGAYAPNGSFFFDLRAGNSYIRMSDGPSIGMSAAISFNNDTFLARSDGYVQALNILARGNIEATSINAGAVRIVSSLMLQNESVTVPRMAQYGTENVGPSRVSFITGALPTDSGNGGTFVSLTFSPMFALQGPDGEGKFHTTPFFLHLRRNGGRLYTWTIGDTVTEGVLPFPGLKYPTVTVTYADAVTGSKSYDWEFERGWNGDAGAGIDGGSFLALGLKITGA